MAWTVEHRRAGDRRGLRYPSDMTDEEWALVAPLIRPAKRGGRPRTAVREVLNAVFCVLSTGCQWGALPKDLPPKSTVWDYLDPWERDGTIERIHHVLYVAVREQAGREAGPTTAIIDSRTAKAAQKGARRANSPPSARRLVRPGGSNGLLGPVQRLPARTAQTFPFCGKSLWETVDKSSKPLATPAGFEPAFRP